MMVGCEFHLVFLKPIFQGNKQAKLQLFYLKPLLSEKSFQIK